MVETSPAKSPDLELRNVVRLLVLSLVFLSIVAFYALELDYRTSSAKFDPDGLTISVARSGDRRSLAISNTEGESVELDLDSEWGPALRTNIFRGADGGLNVMDFGGTWKVTRSPLQLVPARSSGDWVYVGTFIRAGYRSAHEEAECMDTLMSDPLLPPGGRVFRRRC